MEIRYLNEFVVLAQICRFQEAADLLYISQSSLSKHIKCMEQELGHKLFYRSTRRVELTPFGQSFLPYAARISDIRRDYTSALLTPTHSHQQVRLAITPLVTLYNLWPFLPTLHKDYPDASIEIMEQDGDSATLPDMLQRQQCDMVIQDTLDPEIPAEDSFACLRYTSDTLSVLLPKNHPLADCPTIHPDQIKDETFVQLGRTNLMKALWPDAKEPPVIVSRGKMITELVDKQVGLALSTHHGALQYAGPSVSVVPIRPEIWVYLNLYYPKDRTLNPPTTAIIDYLKSRSLTRH